MKFNIKLLSIALIAVTIISCKKDKENPTITIGEPSNHSEHTYGSELHLEATFEDDRELKSYHIYAGDAAGNHATDFDLMFSGDISGKSYDFHEHADIPSGIGSVYYLYFEVVDADDKKTTEQVMIHLIN